LSAARHTLDIFCRVIDNLGDAGVCLRVTRRMAGGFGWSVRIFIDAPEVIAPIVPPGLAHVDVLPWAAAEAPDTVPADCVIEAFGCELPVAYRGRMAARRAAGEPAPRWLNLEYFSCEDWVAGSHGLPSPQADGLAKHFWIPGFRAGSAGVTVLPDTAPDRAARRAGAPLQALLFCYPYAPWAAWLEQAGQGSQTIELWVPAAGLGLHAASTGAVKVVREPLMDQAQFDVRLSGLDFAFVRGEDSVVQAIVSGVPFIWNIYAQDDGAHRPKLAALLDWWCAGLHRDAAAVMQQVHQAWNSHRWPSAEAGVPSLWQRYLDVLPMLAEHARRVARRVRAEADLGTRLSQWVG
jgi:uncharacterized repeat protein (TIGR03837 family)